jgi:hypothetical protein
MLDRDVREKGAFVLVRKLNLRSETGRSRRFCRTPITSGLPPTTDLTKCVSESVSRPTPEVARRIRPKEKAARRRLLAIAAIRAGFPANALSDASAMARIGRRQGGDASRQIDQAVLER